MSEEGVVIRDYVRNGCTHFNHCPCQGPLGSVRSEAWKMETQHGKAQEGAFQTGRSIPDRHKEHSRHREEPPDSGRSLHTQGGEV